MDSDFFAFRKILDYTFCSSGTAIKQTLPLVWKDYYTEPTEGFCLQPGGAQGSLCDIWSDIWSVCGSIHNTEYCVYLTWSIACTN